MKRLFVRPRTFMLGMVLVLGVAPLGNLVATAAEKEGKDGPLAHAVYFTLKDRSKEARTRLVESCKTLLTGHAGASSFSVGTIAEDVQESVSDRDFDVALHVVFQNKAAEQAYLVHPRHNKFVQDNKESWAKVRVFDSYLTAP